MLVLHVLCLSHPCASLARTVLTPSSFLAGAMEPLAILRYRTPTQLVVSEVKSEK